MSEESSKLTDKETIVLASAPEVISNTSNGVSHGIIDGVYVKYATLTKLSNPVVPENQKLSKVSKITKYIGSFKNERDKFNFIKDLLLNSRLDGNREAINLRRVLDGTDNTLDRSAGRTIKSLSLSGKRFEECTDEEKLEAIYRYLENNLWKDSGFATISEGHFYGLISNDDVIKYKKDVQCFRHSKELHLKERAAFDDAKKKFYIEYGIAMINRLTVDSTTKTDVPRL